jgi:hypothetical protein
VNPNGYGQGQFELFRGIGDDNPPLAWRPVHRIVRGVRRPKGARILQ